MYKQATLPSLPEQHSLLFSHTPSSYNEKREVRDNREHSGREESESPHTEHFSPLPILLSSLCMAKEDSSPYQLCTVCVQSGEPSLSPTADRELETSPRCQIVVPSDRNRDKTERECECRLAQIHSDPNTNGSP